MVCWRNARVHHYFELRVNLAALFEEAKGKARANAERILAINAAALKYKFYFLPRGAFARDVRKKDGPSENSWRAVFVLAGDAQRERWPGLLFVAQLELGKHGLFGENMLGHFELKVDSGEHDAREHSGNENAGERAGQNHEKQVVSGVYGGQNENRNRDEVNHSFAREPVINLIDQPAKTGSTCKPRNDDDGHPSGEAERNYRCDCGEADPAFLRSGRRKKCG